MVLKAVAPYRFRAAATSRVLVAFASAMYWSTKRTLSVASRSANARDVVHGKVVVRTIGPKCVS